jgi:hypothetical protein
MSTGSTASGSTYVYGYTAPEQRRLIAQAEFWRDSLILDGTDIPPGARLLDVGCGAGAVLRILGRDPASAGGAAGRRDRGGRRRLEVVRRDRPVGRRRRP